MMPWSQCHMLFHLKSSTPLPMTCWITMTPPIFPLTQTMQNMQTNAHTHTHTSTIPLMCTDPRRMQLHRIHLQASPLLTSTGELHPHPTHLRSINNFLNTFSFGKYCNTMNASMTSVISIVTGLVREPTTLRSAGPQVLNVLVWRSESSKCLTSKLFTYHTIPILM